MIGAGMTSAIMNPCRPQEMEAVRGANVLAGTDKDLLRPGSKLTRISGRANTLLAAGRGLSRRVMPAPQPVAVGVVVARRTGGSTGDLGVNDSPKLSRMKFGTSLSSLDRHLYWLVRLPRRRASVG